MSTILKRVLSLALTLIMLFGMMPVISTAVEDEEIVLSAPSGKCLQAAFRSIPYNINGVLSETDWTLSGTIGSGALFGALWDNGSVYIGVYNPNNAAVSVTLNGTAITGSPATVYTADMYSEYGIPHGMIGSSAADYGHQVSATIQVGSDVWSGTIIFASTSWFATDTSVRQLTPAGRGRAQAALVDADGAANGYQNTTRITNGWKYTDLYNPDGTNPRAMRTYITYQGDYLSPLADRTKETVLEFTFYASAMPVYELGYDNEFWNYMTTAGFTYWITDGASKTRPNMACMGIINTDIGLVFVAQYPSGYQSFPLNRYVGDTFRVGTVWQPDGDVVLYIDGAPVTVFKNIQILPGISFSLAPTIITMNIMRSVDRAESDADNIDVEITSLAIGKAYGTSVIDSLTFDLICGENTDAGAIIKDLVLPVVFKNDQIDTPYEVTWTSSDPDIIDPMYGTVNRPLAGGKTVTLTAAIEALGISKKLELYVKGINPSDAVLAVVKDLDTQNGAGTLYDTSAFTLDANNNSVIRDLGERETVNVIRLKDSDTITRLNESMLTIWASDDNITYRQIDDFKLLRAGEYTYLYDFTAAGRYIKVHATTHDTYASDFIAPLDGMIEAYYEDVFGGGSMTFAASTYVTVPNNASSVAYDTVHTVAASAISCSLANKADVRFYLGDELLYHTYDGEKFLVRVPKIDANSTVTLTVLSGNTEAMDISNVEYVYEVVYGTRETYDDGLIGRYWVILPDGTIMRFSGTSVQEGSILRCISYDEGRSWNTNELVEGTYNYAGIPQGFAYDEETGRIVLQGFSRPVNEDGSVDTNGYVTHYMYSDDMGQTWHQAPVTILGQEQPYQLSYSDIIRVSSFDGEDGPGVDFVHALGSEDPVSTEYYDYGYGVCASFVAYTTDAGKTWTIGSDRIRYFKGSGTAHIREMGLCEQTILEADDGTLVLYTRCQFDDVDHFAVAFSYDYGITWTEEATLSNVYTVNTQPILFEFDGADMLAWCGNNALGGGTYRRFPLNIAVSYDGMVSFEHIQDVYSRTAFQGMLQGTLVDGTNPMAEQIGDSLLLFCGSHINNMRIDNFADYFYRTKGAYDSFENATPEYEGWATTGGYAENSTDHATSGTTSMKFGVGASFVRSIPSVSNGTISFDLWFDDAATADITVELESAYAVDYGKAAPVAFEIENGTLTFLGSTTAANVTLKDGWNHFEFVLALDNPMQTATLSVNGGAAINTPINNGALNNYVCYVSVNCDGAHTYYLDTFVVVDNDEILYTEKQTQVVATELAYVPTALQATYSDTDALADTLTQLMADTYGDAYAKNSTVMDLSLLVSIDGAQSWSDATLADIPMNGIEICLDYPEGTSAETHDFKLIHMFSEDSMRHSVTAGDWESPEITEKEDGLYVRMMGFSPVILAWDQPTEGTAIDNGSNLLVHIAASAAIVIAVAALGTVIVKKSKKRRA